MYKKEIKDTELVYKNEWRLSAVEKYRFSIFLRDFWYDWFCQDKWLQAKGEKLLKRVLDIVNSPKFNKHETYVWFKNNCPMVGRLYDDFRIADIENGNVIFTVSNQNNKWQVYCEGHWREPIIEGTWEKVRKWFMS